MDTYENNPLENEQTENTMPPLEEPAPVQPPQVPQQPFSGGRKDSPYADSPYMNAWETPPVYGYQAPNAGYRYPPYGYQQPAPCPPPVQAEKQPRKVWKTLLAAAGVIALVACGCGMTAASVNRQWQQRNETLTASFNEKLDVLQKKLDTYASIGSGDSVSGSPNTSVNGLTPSQVYARNLQSVVAISNQSVTSNIYGQISETASAGSGFILTEDGYVVSNYHVVEGATTLSVITYDGTEYEAKYIGGDASNDIALLKIEATGLQAATVGSSDKLIVGDQVVAIGNPLGELTSTLTVGYVSAKDRVVTTDGTQINMMQTDAAINPGNSGGPLFNMKGEVVGITTAKYSGTTASGASIEGIGFAIPIDDVLGMLEDLRQFGYVTGAYLGVEVGDMNANEANKYGFPMGAYVWGVTSGSCAQKAGIRPRDIIINVGGHDVESLNDLTRALRKFEAGQTITVTVYRSGQEVPLSVTLDEKPQPTEPQTEPSYGTDLPSGGSAEDWFDYFFGGGAG